MKILLSSNAVGDAAHAVMKRGFSLVVGSSWISPKKAGEPLW